MDDADEVILTVTDKTDVWVTCTVTGSPLVSVLKLRIRPGTLADVSVGDTYVGEVAKDGSAVGVSWRENYGTSVNDQETT